MSVMERFRAKHGRGETYQRPSKAVIAKYKNRMPEDLLAEWQEHGWCSFADGTFFTVNPDAHAESLKEWLPDWFEDGSDTFAFARGAFGDLLVSHDGNAGQLNVHYGRYVDMSGPVDVFLFTLKPTYLQHALRGDLAKKAAKKLGRIAADEMFTFEPALALGGSDTLKSVARVKLFPQLSLLSQLFDSVTIE